MKRSLRAIFSRKWAARVLFALACLATILAVACVVGNRIMRNAWETYRAEAIRRGVKLDLNDWIVPADRDRDGFFGAPIFQSSNVERTRAALQQSGAEMEVCGNERPAELRKIQREYVEKGLIPSASDDLGGDILRGLDAKYGEVWTALREAESRPHGRLAWDPESSIMGNEHMIMLAGVRLHLLRLAAHVARRDGASAEDELRGILRFAHTADDPPSLLYAMIRTLYVGLACDGVWEGIHARVWDDAQLERIEAELRRFDLVADLSCGMAGDRAFWNWAFDDLILTRSGRRIFWSGSDVKEPLWIKWVPEFWFRQDQLRLNDWHDAYQAQFNPQGGPLRVAAFPRPARWYPLAGLTARLTRSNNAHLEHVISVQPRLQQARLACALERHRLASGTYPPALGSLVPNWIPSLPRNVKTGKAPHYELVEGGSYEIRPDLPVRDRPTSNGERTEGVWRP